MDEFSLFDVVLWFLAGWGFTSILLELLRLF